MEMTHFESHNIILFDLFSQYQLSNYLKANKVILVFSYK